MIVKNEVLRELLEAGFTMYCTCMPCDMGDIIIEKNYIITSMENGFAINFVHRIEKGDTVESIVKEYDSFCSKMNELFPIMKIEAFHGRYNPRQ